MTDEQIDLLVRQVSGTMALSGFVLSDADKNRIRIFAKSPSLDGVDRVISQLVLNHKKG